MLSQGVEICDYRSAVKIDSVLQAMAALGQSKRLAALRLLYSSEPEGRCVTEIAQALGIAQNTTSIHLATLARAGLVWSERKEKTVVFHPRIDGARDVIEFLVELVGADAVPAPHQISGPLGGTVSQGAAE